MTAKYRRHLPQQLDVIATLLASYPVLTATSASVPMIFAVKQTTLRLAKRLLKQRCLRSGLSAAITRKKQDTTSKLVF